MTTATKNPAIAEIIRHQISTGTLFMVGAKNLIDHGNGLSFRISCRGAKANYMKVTLDADNTYRVEFSKIGRAPNFKVTLIADLSGVYAHTLCELIETHTGLVTRL